METAGFHKTSALKVVNDATGERPAKSAWEKLARALKGLIEEDRFAQLSGTVSLSFPAGKHKRAAVKVIDPRGNEVMSVHRLEGKKGY